jgi:hypothetical protein
MELLLNLAWVLLALPAYWLWRSAEARHGHGRMTSLQRVLALGCGLVVLFPVISASDDLHAMRMEMEESAGSKRAVRQSASDESSSWANRLQGPPALVASAVGLFAPQAGRFQVSVSGSAPLARPGELHAGRAPPSSLPSSILA